MFNANGASGVPVQVVLDIPPDIYAGLANETLFRVGSVVRNAATGAIVKHLEEGRFPAKETANGVASVVQRFRSSTGGKIAVASLIVPAIGLVVMGGKVVADKWSKRRCTKALNEALAAYLDAAKVGKMTVEQIDALSSAIEAARGSGSSDSVSIAEEVVNLVESYTFALAQANKTIWRPERGVNVVPLVRLERSLSAQRCILGNVGRPQTFAWGRPTFPSTRMFRAPLRPIDQPRQTKRFR